MEITKALERIKEYCLNIYDDESKTCRKDCSIYKILGKCILK